MPLNNRFSLRRSEWNGVVFRGLPAGSGVVFEEMTLDERIGPEAVVLSIDAEPEELLSKASLELNLKAGIASTPYGPILFLIWWIPPIVNGRPSVFYEQVMNPLYSKTSEVLGRVANQTHLHLVVVDLTGQVLTVFEYKNAFGFDAIRAGVDGARVAWPGPDDFPQARRAYEEQYDIDKLLAGACD